MADPELIPPSLVNDQAPSSEQGLSPSSRKIIAVGLSLFAGLFLADASLSLLDDTLLLYNIHALSLPRGILGLGTLGLALVLYLLMGITPSIPKRFFLPFTLAVPFLMLFLPPILIYDYERMQQRVWFLSLAQLLAGLVLLRLIQGRWKLQWPFLPERALGTRAFAWGNSIAFLLANVLVAGPALVFYGLYCASLAIDHFSHGFLTLQPAGLAVHARKYVREDGKTIRLIPMMHVGEPDFYSRISKSFATNSVILLEGVTDRKNLLKRELSYKKMAESLGVAEQKENFEPERGRSVPADVDVEDFSKSTLELIDWVSRFHSKGADPELLKELSTKSPGALLLEGLWEDILTKRNARLLQHLRTELLQADHLAVPWGALHMPGIAEGIQKDGFRLVESEEYRVLSFRTLWRGRTSGQVPP